MEIWSSQYGVMNEVIAQSGVEAHAVLLGVLLLDGAADVAGSVQAGDGLFVLGQDVAIGVDGQTCGGQVEGGVNADCLLYTSRCV